MGIGFLFLLLVGIIFSVPLLVIIYLCLWYLLDDFMYQRQLRNRELEE